MISMTVNSYSIGLRSNSDPRLNRRWLQQPNCQQLGLQTLVRRREMRFQSQFQRPRSRITSITS